MVKSTAENLSPTRVKLTVEVPFEEVTVSYTHLTLPTKRIV